MSRKTAERAFAGTVASRGLAAGIIVVHRPAEAATVAAGTPDEERDRLDRAVAKGLTELAALIEGSGDLGGEILEFQQALLEDPELLEPARQAIAEGRSAAAAWGEALGRQIADYQAADDDYFRARALDLADLRERVAAILAGAPALPPADAIAGALYLARELTPSRFLEADWSQYRGAALTGGSASSHVAVLARARGLPLLVGLEASDDEIGVGAEAILDAEAGRLIQDPAPGTRARYARRIEARHAAAQAEARYLAGPAVLPDGERVRVQVNVDDPRILEAVDPAHCDGVGLMRSEFLFTGGLPDEDSQLRAYRALLDWAGGKPVIVRTLDAGGDKPVPGLTLERETNPFLGLRGLRLSLARPEVFRVQLRALARAATAGALKVMFPMVTAPHELAAARALFQEVVRELNDDRQDARLPPLGMMVEVPAAALNIRAFDADFVSIGSNDLVQYVTAASRDCAEVAALLDPLDPAVLELIGRVVAWGRESGTEVGLCGDMAGEPAALSALLDLGLRSVSVAPAQLAQAKAAVARHG